MSEYVHSAAAFARITVTKEVVTPALARKWLTKASAAGFINRTLSPATVEKYGREMATDRWIPETCEPLHLTRDEATGEEFPINGYHRLTAIANSGAAVPFFVAHDIPRGVFHYYDAGRPRDLASIMEIQGWSSYGPKATCGRMLYKEAITGDPTKNPSAAEAYSEAEIFDWLEGTYNGLINELFDRYLPLLRKIQKGPLVDGIPTGGYGPVGVIGYFVVSAEAIDRDLMDRALAFMASSDTPAPCLNWKWLKNYLAWLRNAQRGDDKNIPKGRHKDFSDLLISAWVVAWNLTREGTHLRSYTSFKAAVDAHYAAPAWVGLV